MERLTPLEKREVALKTIDEQRKRLGRDVLIISIPIQRFFENGLNDLTEVNTFLDDFQQEGVVEIPKTLTDKNGMTLPVDILEDSPTTYYLRVKHEKFDKHFKKIKAQVSKSKDKGQKPSLKISYTSDLYNPETAELQLAGKTIKMPPRKRPDFLCQVLFSSTEAMKKEWCWDEIVERPEWGDRAVAYREKYGREPWRPVYNAANSINDRIAKKTGIEDFVLRPNIQTIKINPRYLK